MPWQRHINPAFLLTLALTAFASLALTTDAFSLLCLLLAGGGMVLFCQRRSGRLGAMIAGLVYACSPQLLTIIGEGRGLLALALLPVLLWRVDALRDRPVGANFILVFLTQVALLAVGATAIWLGGLAALWIACEALIQHINRESSRLRAGPSLLALLALLLGTLAAIPFLQSPLPLTSDELVPLLDLLAAPSDMESPRLGMAQWTLALAGVLGGLALYLRGYRTRHPNTFLGATFFALMALALLAFAQSYALITACLAILAGLNGFWLEQVHTRYQASSIALVVALPIISIFPLQSVASDPDWSNSLDMLFALDATALISLVALLAALAVSLRLGKPDLAWRLYWGAPPLTSTALIGALAGAALAICVWLILP